MNNITVIRFIVKSFNRIKRMGITGMIQGINCLKFLFFLTPIPYKVLIIFKILNHWKTIVF